MDVEGFHVCCCGNKLDVQIVQRIKVDACIADEIVWLNAKGVRTEGCCCGHGDFPPEAMIKPSSADAARKLGYDPVYQSDVGLFKIKLKGRPTGG